MMTEINVTILIFLCVIQGTYGAVIQYNASATAVEGQNVSLHCIVGEDQLVTQLEWIKHLKGNGMTEQKIVVYHSMLNEYYYHQRGPLLETVTSPKTGNIQGSILTLYGVTVKDSGDYICEITSFPNGSIKRTAELQVTEAPASVKMSDSYEFITEGDELKITCSASPPPLRYKLQRSKDKLFIKESLNGTFILPNITRNYSDVYMCSPEWSSSHHNQQRLNATLELTVNFLDAIECNTSSPLNVSFGEDVAISCKAKASQHLKYKWMRGDVTSLSDTLSLTSVTSDQAGTYKFTAGFQKNTLQKHVDFHIHVISKQRKETTTVSPVRTTQHLSSLTSVWSSSWSSGAMESRTTQSVKPNATVTKLQPQLTSRRTALTGGSSAPPAGSASTLHASTLRSTDRVQEIVQTRINTNTATGTTVNPTARRYTAVTTYSVTTKKLTTISVAIQKDSRSSAYIAIPIVLLVLLLIALLYRRYLNQKKMDMPPPFKPPPPPVKYTSVRHHEVLMTDILV